LRVSKRTRYGVRLMLELALNYSKKPLSVSQIASNEEISSKFLSQIIIPLKGAGLIQSTRGALGGYELTRAPGKITLLEVFRVLEGDCLLAECVSDASACNRSSACTAKEIWDDLSVMIEEKLKAVTFQDLAERAKEKSENNSHVYQI
jgi:Rrf2 family protein